MKTSQIVAKTIETAFCDKPGFMGMVATSETEAVEIIFKTAQAPAIAAGILISSQDAVKRMSIENIAEEMAKNLDNSLRVLPEAIDVSLTADGDVLCINVGSGALFLKLTGTAKEKFKGLGTTIGEFLG